MRKWKENRQESQNEGLKDAVSTISKKVGSFLFDPMVKRVRDILDDVKKNSGITDSGWFKDEKGNFAIRVTLPDKKKSMDIVCHSNGTSVSYKENPKEKSIQFSDDDFMTVANLSRFKRILCDFFGIRMPLTSSVTENEEELEEAFSYKIKDILVRSLIWQVFYLAKGNKFRKYKIAVKGSLKDAYFYAEYGNLIATIDVEKKGSDLIFVVRLHTKNDRDWNMKEVETDDAQVALDTILMFFKTGE